MFAKLIKVLMIVLIASCSSMSKNLTLSGEVYFRGGVLKDKSWESDLIFKRKSWYKELTLAYDVLITSIDSSSDFFPWFSKSNQENIRRCADFKIFIAYSWDTQKINYLSVIKSIRKQGFVDYPFTDFKTNLEMHPSYYPRGFHSYKLWGLCSSEKGKEIVISIPGYKDVVLK